MALECTILTPNICAKPKDIRNSCSSFQTISQLTTETEVEYSTRLNEAVYDCGNVHGELDKMTFFMNGFSSSIQTIVARYLETQPHRYLTYNAVVQITRDVGGAFRVQVGSDRDLRTQNMRNRTTNTGFNVIHDSMSLNGDQEESLNAPGVEEKTLHSVPTTDFS